MAIDSIPTSSSSILHQASDERALGRVVVWLKFGHEDTTFDDRDSAPFAPLASGHRQRVHVGGRSPLRTPWHETLIYELHVKDSRS